MSDTVVFGKTVTSSFKTMLLFVIAGAALSVGEDCLSLQKNMWDGWWSFQKFGWLMLQLGNIATIVKAYYADPNAKSSPPPEPTYSYPSPAQRSELPGLGSSVKDAPKDITAIYEKTNTPPLVPPA
jgi:hypothetical protein